MVLITKDNYFEVYFTNYTNADQLLKSLDTTNTHDTQNVSSQHFNAPPKPGSSPRLDPRISKQSWQHQNFCMVLPMVFYEVHAHRSQTDAADAKLFRQTLEFNSGREPQDQEHFNNQVDPICLHQTTNSYCKPTRSIFFQQLHSQNRQNQTKNNGNRVPHLDVALAGTPKS